MAEGTIAIGSITLDTPVGYTHDLDKLESYGRAIKGNMIINRSVTSEDQPIDIYRFEISDVVNSELRDLEAEARHIGNLDYVDHIQIKEVLSGDGVTRHFWTQRRMSGADPLPTVTVGVTDFPVIVDTGDDPPTGKVYAQLDDLGRAKFTFKTGEAPADTDNNIIIQYEPKYYVHIMDYYRTGIIMDVARYLLICEESK